MFTKDTFRYFDQANENKFTKGWFEENKAFYQDSVRSPFEALVNRLELEFGDQIPLSAKKISRPLRPSNRHQDKGIVKDFSSIIASKPKPNRFEQPPCLHIQLGALEKDNFICMGMYLENSKQKKKIHLGIGEHFDQVINEATPTWGELQGKKFKRTPEILNQDLEPYYWFKTYYLNNYFTRSEMIQSSYPERILELVSKGMPFFKHLEQILS